MMTCRLLCALLVLALCCCPSVCVTTSDAEPAKDIPTPSVTQSGEEVDADLSQDLGTDTHAGLKNERTAEEGLRNEEPASPKGQEDNVELQVPNTTTTTTTTKAPTTTTTTTTPEAPSTTSTEAPTTTTTRAPSRLREVDGSLSSSAWVCAPLLLAASALAYTAVG
ncbi:mucin TcMUCII [Trypanosoma cruzi cruzi]|uniref:Putative mucin TcMUCII n=1 Tax=Trypanosoma cruzi TaxID=5693 RepID=A0A2V2UZM8_TRYCR|nr:mucin TcMUCII [Trypanosoma cruzi cruzi]PWU89474.1 putative mucin TcMUCII [Trypanosoma cruzi]